MTVTYILFGFIDMKPIERKPIYQANFYPIFHAINQCIDALDDLGIATIVGDRCAKAFADSFVQLVMATWDAIPCDVSLSHLDKDKEDVK